MEEHVLLVVTPVNSVTMIVRTIDTTTQECVNQTNSKFFNKVLIERLNNLIENKNVTSILIAGNPRNYVSKVMEDIKKLVIKDKEISIEVVE